jgi:hypothetical protein
MSPEEVKRRFPHASPAFIAANATRLPECVPHPPSWRFEMKQSGDESKLNKLETEYLGWLRTQGDDWIGVMAITLKLAHDCRLTPDFWAFDKSGLRAIDVKGPHVWEDSLIKYRVAARMFPFIRFVLATKNGLIWKHKDVKP